MPFILTILSKVWKPLLGGVVVVSILMGVYFKGKSVERNKWQRAVLEETIKREREERKVQERGAEVIKEFEKTKDKPYTPEKTEYYECLLGDNPLECTHG